MKAFLAVSMAPDAGEPTGLARAVARVSAGPAHRTDDGWVAFGEPEQDDRTGDPGRFTVRLVRAVRTRSGDLGTAALAGLLGRGEPVDGKGLAEVLPPFAAAHRDGTGAPVVVAGDWLGLRQLYRWQGDGVAAVSTSALALAELAGTGLDVPALAAQSLVGWQLGLATPFTGVTKLGPGTVAVLHRGRVEVRPYLPEDLTLDGPVPAVPALVDEMAELLVELHRGYLSDHPGTVLQLTGGQDSRLLLCAVPRPMRTGLRALTLDTHGGVESTIAARLSALSGLEHQVLWLDDQAPVDPQTAYRYAVESARVLDCMASPLALAPLLLAERHLDQGHRLSGAGGETARGFYYAGQPRTAATSDPLVRRLAAWRLFTNEAVAADALEPEFVAHAKTGTALRLEEIFHGYARDWLPATDEFYLFQRTQRWAGAHGTVAAVERFFVNPLLDRRFVQLVMAVPPDDKRNSRLTGRLMARLDPELASVPLDSGLVPARLGRRGPASTLQAARVTARKATGKVRQRLGGGRRPQLGAGDIARLVIERWRAEPSTVDGLRRVGFVRSGWLDEVLDGRRTAEPTTVAFLLNVLVAAEAGTAPEDCRGSDGAGVGVTRTA